MKRQLFFLFYLIFPAYTLLCSNLLSADCINYPQIASSKAISISVDPAYSHSTPRSPYQSLRYRCYQTPLHQIADDLEKITGIRIFAGNNRQDIQVRYLPLTIYAENVSLDALLKAIADACHLRLIEEQDIKRNTSYRIFRETGYQKDLSHYLDDYMKWQLDHLYWQWTEYAKDLLSDGFDNNLISDDLGFTRDLAVYIYKLNHNSKKSIFYGDGYSVQIDKGKSKEEQKNLIASLVKNIPNAFQGYHDYSYKNIKYSIFTATTGSNPILNFSFSMDGHGLDEFALSMKYKDDHLELKKPNEPEFIFNQDVALKFIDPFQVVPINIDIRQYSDESRYYSGNFDIINSLTNINIVYEDYDYTSGRYVEASLLSSGSTSLPQAVQSIKENCNAHYDPKNNILIAHNKRWPELQKTVVRDYIYKLLETKADTTGIHIEELISARTATPYTSLESTPFIEREYHSFGSFFAKLDPGTQRMAFTNQGFNLGVKYPELTKWLLNKNPVRFTSIPFDSLFRIKNNTTSITPWLILKAQKQPVRFLNNKLGMEMSEESERVVLESLKLYTIRYNLYWKQKGKIIHKEDDGRTIFPIYSSGRLNELIKDILKEENGDKIKNIH